jgi:hypothetical protein
MARTAARLPDGTRISDHVILGVLTTTVPAALIDAVLAETGRQSQRYRRLPARLVVYYVMALALYAQTSYSEVLRCLVEGVRWLRLSGTDPALADKSAICRARTRLGPAPLKALFARIAAPFATPDTPDLAERFGRPAASRGKTGFPQLRLLTLAETGTHALFAVALDRSTTSEVGLAPPLLAVAARHAVPGRPCLRGL